MPDHPFEALDDQRFQQFCQALIARAFPDVQCLPVAQPDGGRDALVRFQPSEYLLVFQVKFARSPDDLKDPSAWVTRLLEEERPKIDRLVERGATQYKLVTNLSATAHLEGGSLDRVQRILDELPIPAECWWRDDLNRRLEGFFDLKLSYPELFTGNDLIRLLAERGENSEHAARRGLAIKTYLAEQYERDREVRFRQIDFVDDLMKMFIDVPAEPAGGDGQGPSLLALIRELRRGNPKGEGVYYGPAGSFAGAGSLLLSGNVQQYLPHAMVEGAPGQGKSTMLQYVCQVHRLRILDRDETEGLPDSHLKSPVRLPFKVDLRDFAQWLAGGKEPRDAGDLGDGTGSLEGFLAASVARSSGGTSFNVDDLQAIASESNVLLALDGLDEVGDIGDRAVVVAAIEAAVSRLDEIAASLQTIVTCRPASFVGTASLAEEKFTALRLQSIEKPLIDTYADKWMQARRLSPQERSELSGTLDEKLRYPHIRDLAQNPMQLAILLDLIHRRGAALPDQRTALYSSYMDLFLDREAEKSKAVLEHRDLLFALHGHIAWLLHCKAEKQGEVGRFTTAEIETVVGDFLQGRGYNRDLFEDLFGGVFDRVGALVSSAEGTYEFEVQPLREFFAAHHLYKTATYSASGDPRTGTRPERFDAMARQPYWLNVMRFYAGFYDAGELASLAECLGRLCEDVEWGRTTHPRVVSARVLADRTFQQNRLIQGRVVELLEGDLQIRGVATDQALEVAKSLPEDCGGEQLAERALLLLRHESLDDRRAALAAVVQAQIPDPEERSDRWLAFLGELNDRDRWYRSARDLGLRASLTAAEIDLTADAADSTLEALLYARWFEAFDGNGALSNRVLRVVLDSPEVGATDDPSSHPIPVLAELLRIDRVTRETMGQGRMQAIEECAERDTSSYDEVNDFARSALDIISRFALPSWRTELTPWEELVEVGRRLFGDGPALTALGIASTRIPDPLRRKVDGDLFDASFSLCHRAGYARISAGDLKWWKGRLADASTDAEKVMALALAWCWGTEDTLRGVWDDLMALQDGLASSSQGHLVRFIERCSRMDAARGLSLFLATRWLPGELGPLTFTCVSQRMPRQIARQLYLQSGPFDESALDDAVLDRLAKYEFEAVGDDPERWETTASILRGRYTEAEWLPRRASDREALRHAVRMPLAVAERIMQNAEEYPLALVARAEARCMLQVQSALERVGEVSVRDEWFAAA